MGLPLQCESIDLTKSYKLGGPIPLTRIKTLVSMTTPKDFRAHSSLPPFCEFDMSAEGFGCLYLPSVAPQTVNASGNLDGQISGGIGSGENVTSVSPGLFFKVIFFCR